MAQYEEAASTVLSEINTSGLNSTTKDTIAAILGTTGNVTINSYDGTPAEDGTQVVTVGANQQLTSDPGGEIIIMDADAGAANATLDASQDRVVVASSNADNLTFTGSGNVTVETGGGNDSITTGDGDDLIIANGDGDVTVKTGGGNDEVIVQGTGTRTIDLSDSDGSGTNTVIIQSSEVEIYVTGGDGTDLVFLDEDRNVHEFSINEETGQVIFHSENPTTLKNVEFVQFGENQLTVIADTFEESVIAKLYQIAFDRDADVEGMTFWMDFLEKGNSLEHTVYSFVNSVEFREHHASQTNEQYVVSLYKGFDRAADDAGVAYWVGQLNNGDATRDDVAWAFAESAEATQVMGIDGTQYVIEIF